MQNHALPKNICPKNEFYFQFAGSLYVQMRIIGAEMRKNFASDVRFERLQDLFGCFAGFVWNLVLGLFL